MRYNYIMITQLRKHIYKRMVETHGRFELITHAPCPPGHYFDNIVDARKNCATRQPCKVQIISKANVFLELL